MMSVVSNNATMRQNSIHTKREERLGWTTKDEWLGFTGGLLDNSGEDVFTVAYIPQIAM